MSNIVLHNYQAAALPKLNQFLESDGCVMMYAPTGAGKTVMITAIVSGMVKQGKKVAVFAGSIALINQLIIAMNRVTKVNVIQGSNTKMRNSLVTVISTQTARARQIEKIGCIFYSNDDDKYDMIIVDEAHEYEKWLVDFLFASQKRGTHIVGFSATPLNAKTNIFYKNVVNVATTAELIKNGYLVGIRVFEPRQYLKTVAYRNLKLGAGEISEGDAEGVGREIVGDAVAEYQKLANGKSFFCFGTTVAHCKILAKKFEEADIKVGLYTHDIDDRIREENLRKIKSGELQGLICVDSLTTGVDVPMLECIINCRILTRSITKHIQILGRVMRSFAGKSHAVVIDMTGNYSHFIEKFNDIMINGINALECQEKTEKQRKKDRGKGAVFCERCNAVYTKSYAKMKGICRICGHILEYNEKEVPQHIEGEIVESGGIASQNQNFQGMNRELIIGQFKFIANSRGYKLNWVGIICGEFLSSRISREEIDVAKPTKPTKPVINFVARKNREYSKQKRRSVN